MSDFILNPDQFHPVAKLILWFIGIPAKEIPWKHRITGKIVKFEKKHDGQATYKEIEDYLTKCAQIKGPRSRSTIHLRLKELEEGKWIENIGPKERGKAAIYTLTPEGEVVQRVFDEFLNLDYKLGQTPGVLGSNTDKNGKIYALSMIRIVDRQNINLMKQAVDYVNKKKSGKEFLRGFFAAQRLAVLMYCLNLVNPRMKMAIEEAIGEKGLKSTAKNLSNFLKLLKK